MSEWAEGMRQARQAAIAEGPLTFGCAECGHMPLERRDDGGGYCPRAAPARTRRAMTPPRLISAEMPPGPGKRVVLRIPAGNEMVTRENPLLPGAGFTLDFGGDVWRSELRAALPDEHGVIVELEITGRYAEDADISSSGSRSS